MISSMLFTLALFTELSGRSLATASPSAKVDDGAIELDGMNSLMADESVSERAAVMPVFKGNLVLDDFFRDEDTLPSIIVVSDARQRGHGPRGLNSVFSRSLPPLTDRKPSHTPAEYNYKVDRRDTDINMLRCMIGRVYRPCWDVSNMNMQ